MTYPVELCRVSRVIHSLYSTEVDPIGRGGMVRFSRLEPGYGRGGADQPGNQRFYGNL